MTRTRPKLPVKQRMVRAQKNTPAKGKAGRKGHYQPWMADTAKEMVGKLGARISDLAVMFNVCEGTIDYWIRHREDFESAVKQGRTECMLQVAQGLFKKATGFTHPDTHILTNRVKVFDEHGNVAEEHTEALMIPIVKYYPPDTPAAIKYLSILGRELGWSEVHNVSMDVNHSGDINIHKVEELSMEDLSEEVKALLFDINLKQLSDVQLQ